MKTIPRPRYETPICLLFICTVLLLVEQAAAQDAWRALSNIGAPTPRIFYHANTAIWTGTEMIIWGGSTGLNQATILGDGAVYNPTTDTWRPTSAIAAPSARANFSAIWTGTEMIIWGGYADHSGGFNTGARYNPALDTWTPISTFNAPTPRNSHNAVWTGTEMIIWGGYDYDGSYHIKNDGGRYNPLTDSWLPVNIAGAPSPRFESAAVWTGEEMIVWGGQNNATFFGDGARYNPITDSWNPVQSNGAPPARADDISAVWTGAEMVIWAGQPFSTSGGRYNPRSDTWRPISSIGAPSARIYNSVVWTGTEMIIWGGQNGTRTLNDGGLYNPITDSWLATTTSAAPVTRNVHSAVWTGDEMIIWGGSNNTFLGAADGYLNDTYAYGSCNGAPVFDKCPTNIVVGTGLGAFTCSRVVTWTPPTIARACSAVTLSSDHNPGDTFPVGVTTVNYTAKDASGNTANCSFTVTVLDTTPPIIGSCPTDLVVNADSPAGAVVSFQPPTVTDNCAVASVSCSPSPGSIFPIGTNQITCTAFDASGNATSCSFTIIVLSPSQQLNSLISLAQSMNVPLGIRNSLVSKLMNARTALSSQQTGYLNTACALLNAFTNEVQAQSGKAITSSVDLQLLGAVRNIETALGCR